MSETESTTRPSGAGVFSAADIKRRMAERAAAKATEELQRMREHEQKPSNGKSRARKRLRPSLV